jgi:hypothetical protein
MRGRIADASLGCSPIPPDGSLGAPVECSLAILITPVGLLIDRVGFRALIKGDGKAGYKMCLS